MSISHTLILLSPTHFKTPLQTHTHLLRPNPIAALRPSTLLKLRTHKTQCKTATVGSNGEAFDWKKWVPNKVNFGPDKVLQSIAGATSSPICQFITSPTTFLHSVDPRIKLAQEIRVAVHFLPLSLCYSGFWSGSYGTDAFLWLTSGEYSFQGATVWLIVLVFLPARSHIYMRFGIVLSLSLLSTWILPKDVWIDQLGRVILLSIILFIVLGLTADSVLPSVSQRTPPPSLTGLSSIPSSFKGYTYILFKFGPLQMTRKGLSVASTSACLTFTILQSASLCLSTTPPEQLASALRWFLLPLAHIGVPVAEIVLTLMLSLRFINLIFDEVRNVALGILSRRIDWQDLTLLEKVDVFVMYIRRIFKNIFSHAEQISQAMIVRGFRGDSNRHKIHFQHSSSFMLPNIISLLALCGVIGATRLSGSLLV